MQCILKLAFRMTFCCCCSSLLLRLLMVSKEHWKWSIWCRFWYLVALSALTSEHENANANILYVHVFDWNLEAELLIFACHSTKVPCHMNLVWFLTCFPCEKREWETYWAIYYVPWNAVAFNVQFFDCFVAWIRVSV